MEQVSRFGWPEIQDRQQKLYFFTCGIGYFRLARKVILVAIQLKISITLMCSVKPFHWSYSNITIMGGG